MVNLSRRGGRETNNASFVRSGYNHQNNNRGGYQNQGKANSSKSELQYSTRPPFRTSILPCASSNKKFILRQYSTGTSGRKAKIFHKILDQTYSGPTTLGDSSRIHNTIYEQPKTTLQTKSLQNSRRPITLSGQGGQHYAEEGCNKTSCTVSEQLVSSRIKE